MSNYIRNYWYKTSDPEVLITVNQYADSDPVVVDTTDPDQVEQYGPVPSDFGLVATLDDATEQELVEAAAEWGLTVDLDTVAITLSIA